MLDRNVLTAILGALLWVPFPTQAGAPTMLWEVAPHDRPLVPAGSHTAAADATGDLLVVATEQRGTGACVVTAKYAAANGALLWRREACGDASTYAVAVAVDGAGNGIAAGNVSGRFRALKYSGGTGGTMWDRPFAGDGLEVVAGMALGPRGDVFLMGRTVAPSSEIWIAKHHAADGSLAWQQPVDAGVEVHAVGIAMDGGGNAFVVGNYTEANGDADWTMAKLAGTSGAVLWRKIHDTGGHDVAAAIAVDRAGDVTVAALAGAAFDTIKHEGATGRTIWEATQPIAGAGSLAAVLHDAAGAVVVAGAVNGDLRALKYAAADGALLWQASHAGGGAGEARALALDAAGNVAVTGRTLAADATAEIRTVKYAAADGAQLWSVAAAGGGRDDAGDAVIAASGGLYAVGRSTSRGGGAALHVIKYVEVGGALGAPAINVQGLWWNPAESGWGVNLAQQGETIFATWFTYDAAGHGQWLVMSDGRRIGDNSYTGTLYRTRGPAFDAMPFEPVRVSATPVGTASFSFTDGSNGLFRYTVDGVSGSKPIARQVFGTRLPECALGGAQASLPVYQDLWWANGGTESGWGLNITHQGDVLFITWFTYAADGSGMWLVGSNVAKTGNATFRGTLYRTVGPPFSSQPWNASKVAAAPAGMATLTFAEPDRGTFAYTLDGVTQQKEITRQSFASPPTVCR